LFFFFFEIALITKLSELEVSGSVRKAQVKRVGDTGIVISSQVKGKGKGHSITGHEGQGGIRGIALFFL
jgi:hypothetical protein